MLNILVGKKMNYTLAPSLEHTSLVKIAATLWNQNDIRALVGKFDFPLFSSERREKWQEIENKVIEKIPQLSLPESLKEKILDIIKPVGLQILKWRGYHDENCYLGIDLPNELCWTPQGTMDEKKTAEALIKDESLDICTRYKLACIYCLEDDVRELWGSMHPRKKAAFYKGGHPSLSQEHKLVVFWTYDIKGEAAKLNGLIKKIKGKEMSPYQFAFEYAAVGGNKAATEYFLQKLTPREREESLVSYAGYVATRHCVSARNHTDLPKENYADVLYFLLSQMDEEQQIKVFKCYRGHVLECLLDWPYQSLLMEVTNRLCDFLSEDTYEILLSIILEKNFVGYKDCNYQKLFGEFWKQSPDAHKRYVTGRCSSSSLLLASLLIIEDTENVRLILKNATVKEKEEIVFNYKGMNICANLIYSNKWDVLKFFLQECIPFKDVIIKFKEEFKKHAILNRSEENFEIEKYMWNKAFRFLDDLAQKNVKKRSMEDGECSPAKSLRSTELEKITDGIKK